MFSDRQKATLAKVTKAKTALDAELHEKVKQKMKEQRIESKLESEEVKYKKPGLE